MDRTIEGTTRIYRIGWFQRLFCLGFTAFGVFLGIALWGGRDHRHKRGVVH
jgi:hypothetical protein